ncbi:hypothetical protein B4064_3221 [Caldibacillus thermoamylovorans]|nr:hypothetical protein B4064_3221 [Caldibacillus thermoamylovorans]
MFLNFMKKLISYGKKIRFRGYCIFPCQKAIKNQLEIK